MDRSSMRVVESTHDYDKRVAFKANLSKKLEQAPTTETVVKEEPFTLGQRVWHPDLGNCIIFKIDVVANEIILQVENRLDTFSLILSQVRTKLGPAKSEAIKSPETAFIGDTINRDLKPKLGDMQAIRDPNNVVRNPESVSSRTHEGFSTGQRVWHPELGSCEIVLIDKNEIVLKNNEGQFNLVLSQVQSKLLHTEVEAEHVPLKPLKREQLASRVPKPIRELSVTLPSDFNKWSLASKYHYLSYNQHLTADEANDVFAVLDGKSPLQFKVSVSWDAVVESDPIAVLPAVRPSSVQHELVGKRVWAPEFGECSVFSIENGVVILLTDVGHVPFVQSHIMSKLVPLADGEHVELAPKPIRKEAISEPVELNAQTISVELPKEFTSWKPVEQYQFLQMNLSSEDASDVVAILDGKPSRSPASKFDISWIDSVPQTFKPGVKEDLFYKGFQPSYEDINTVTPAVRSVVESVIEHQAVVKKIRIPIVLPSEFNNWKTSDQHIFLTKTLRLTPNEAEDIISINNGGAPSSNNVEYTIETGPDNTPIVRIEEFSDGYTTEIVKKKKLSMKLPNEFKSWSASTQYGYLTTGKKLTPEEANDAMVILSGGIGSDKSVEYDIIFTENGV